MFVFKMSRNSSEQISVVLFILSQLFLFSGAFVLPYRESDSCGKVGQVTSYIYGGKKSQIEKWPWQLHLKIVDNKVDKLIKYNHGECGGIRLNDQWILTAGHCLTEHQKPNIYLLDGHNSTKLDNYKLIKYDRLIIHPKYKEFSGSRHSFAINDIALIKLNSSNTFENKHAPPCLPRRGTVIPPYSTCYITGYGAEHMLDDNQIKRFKEGKVAIKPDESCIKSLSLRYYDSNTMICAGRATKSLLTNPCQGDSGGPLVCKVTFDDSRPDQWFLFGITSFGALDCSSYHNSVYTKVSSYVDWIYETMELYR